MASLDGQGSRTRQWGRYLAQPSIPDSVNWATSYKLFPPTSQLLTVMVIGGLVPLTPPP
jgi:hypothetical protein